MDELLDYTPVSTAEDILLALRRKIDELPRGEDSEFVFRTAAALHRMILEKVMAGDASACPLWDREEAIRCADKKDWGYSSLQIPEIATTMRRGAVFFSNNSNPGLENADIRRILSVIRAFGDTENLKAAAALFQLTVHSEEACAMAEQISETANLPIETVRECLLGELAPLIEEKDGPDSRFRFEGIYRHIIPVLSLLDIK